MTEQYRQITLEQYIRKTQPLPEVDTVAGKKAEAKKGQINTVLKIVAEEYDIAPEDILGPSRRMDIAQARHVAAYFLVANTDLSLKAVAIGLGRTDHTTILNSLNRVQEQMAIDPHFRERIEAHPLSVKNSQ